MKKLKHTFQLDENVLLKSLNTEVRIVEFLDEEYILVKDENDDFPVHFSDLSYGKPQVKYPSESIKKTIPLIAKPKTENVKVSRQVQVLFLPEFDLSLGENELIQYRIYLHNQTSHPLSFHVIQKQNQVITFELKNELLPFQNFFSHTIKPIDLDFMPKFELTIFNDPILKKTHTIEKKISSKEFAKKQMDMTKNNEPYFSFLLFDYDQEKESKEKHQTTLAINYDNIETLTGTKETLALMTNSPVVDLHAEKLGLSKKDYTNGEILELQMQEFEKKLLSALHQNCDYFIAIHGIGNGVLKNKIHAYLSACTFVTKFVNQYHPKYGYGCTEIYF